MAHAIDRLALLYPYPDAVRGFALHKTLTSSRLTSRSQPYDKPGGTISLAVADCKYRAPLSPHSAQCIHFNPNRKKLQAKYYESLKNNCRKVRLKSVGRKNGQKMALLSEKIMKIERELSRMPLKTA